MYIVAVPSHWALALADFAGEGGVIREFSFTARNDFFP